MPAVTAYFVLLLAAVLEAGGDALVRSGLGARVPGVRLALFCAGAATLFGYGLTVNAPPWDFGRLLGVYVTLFFLTAQVMNFVLFGLRPSAAIWAGGGLIMAGGLLIAFWRG